MSDGFFRALWIILPTCAFVEILLRGQLVSRVFEIKSILDKSFRTVRRNKVSDRWKEKALLGYSRRTLVISFRVFLIFAVSLVIALLLIFLEAVAVSRQMTDVLTDLGRWDVMLSSALVALIYIRARTRLLEKPIQPT